MYTRENPNAVGIRYYRAAHPRARRTAATAIIHNGSRRTVFDCICGATHSCSTEHRDRTLHVSLWRADHADCAQAWVPLGLA